MSARPTAAPVAPETVIDFLAAGHEATLLSALLEGKELPPDITSDKFTIPAHQQISIACEELRREGIVPNPLAVTDSLARKAMLDAVGGQGAVTSISLTTATPPIVEYALSEFRETSALRRRAEIGERLKAGLPAAQGIELLRKTEAQPSCERPWLDVIDSATVSSSALGALELDPRRPLLSEWLCEGDYGIIFAPRGVGKTWLALLIGKAVSSGGRVGEWHAPNRAKVLYIDGEMPPDLMRDRDHGLGEGEVEFLNHAILFDRTERVLNITDPSLQAAILERCIRDRIKLLILDNLSTLASGVKENDSYEWEQLQNWLLHFRRHGIAVILIHHAGRNGEARGTSKREDAAFWVIALDDAKKQADDKRGARFISRFTKPSRNTQEEVPPHEWHIVTDSSSGQVFVGCKVAQSLDVFRQLIADGVTDCGQLAEMMHVSPGTISKMAKKAIDAGWLKKNGRGYALVKGGNDGNEDT